MLIKPPIGTRVPRKASPCSIRCRRPRRIAAASLPAPQQEFLEALAGLGKPVVLVLLGGSAISVPWAAERVNAILHAWYPGEQGGAALADLGPGPRYLLDEQATVDLRDRAIDADPVFILGDHLGLSAEARALLGEARSISVGPVSIHADDAVAVVQNELDRCQVSISSVSIGPLQL